MDFQRPQGQKLAKSFAPPPIHRFHPFELKFLLWVDGRNWGRCFFFFSKIPNTSGWRTKILSTSQNLYVFWILKILRSLPNLIGRRYPKTKKNTQPKSLEVSPKKFSARSDLKWRRKGGQNWFLIPKKLVSRKMQNKKNL